MSLIKFFLGMTNNEVPVDDDMIGHGSCSEPFVNFPFKIRNHGVGQPMLLGP